MAVRIFLILSSLIWLPYGIYCFLDPGSLADVAGVSFQSPTGGTELRAMYGGLQAALGVLAGLAVFRPTLLRPALLAIAFLTAGLGTARLLGFLLDGGMSTYTGMGLGFEFTSAAVAGLLLRRSGTALA